MFPLYQSLHTTPKVQNFVSIQMVRNLAVLKIPKITGSPVRRLNRARQTTETTKQMRAKYNFFNYISSKPSAEQN